MDLFDLIDEQLDELENPSGLVLRRIPRNRVFKVRVDYFADLDASDFFVRFRLSKSAVNHVHNLIKHKIMPKTQRNQAVSSKTSLLLTLRYLATGSFLRSAADFCGQCTNCKSHSGDSYCSYCRAKSRYYKVSG